MPLAIFDWAVEAIAANAWAADASVLDTTEDDETDTGSSAREDGELATCDGGGVDTCSFMSGSKCMFDSKFAFMSGSKCMFDSKFAFMFDSKFAFMFDSKFAFMFDSKFKFSSVFGTALDAAPAR